MPSLRERHLGQVCSEPGQCYILTNPNTDLKAKENHLKHFSHPCEHALCPDGLKCVDYKESAGGGFCRCPLKHYTTSSLLIGYYVLLKAEQDDRFNAKRQTLFNLHCRYSPDPTLFPNTLYQDFSTSPVVTKQEKTEIPFLKKTVVEVPKTKTHMIPLLAPTTIVTLHKLFVQTAIHSKGCGRIFFPYAYDIQL